MGLKLRPAGWISKFGLIAVVIFGSLAPVVSSPAADMASPNETAAPNPDRYRAFLLKYISPQQGKQFLADANITNISQVSDSNTLLVTAKPDVLVKAAALLAMVDSREKYAVKVLLPASDANRMPSADAMAAEIGKISIGTFYNIPGGTGYKAIIDTHEDKLIAIAPVAVMDKFVEYADVVKRAGPLPEPEEGLASQPVAGTGPAAPDKAFDELLDSISKAESNLKSSSTVKQKTSPKAESVAIKPLKQAAKSDKKITGKDKKTAEPNLETTASAEPNNEEKVQNQYEPIYAVNADETLELALPEKLKVIDLLDLIGKYLNLNYVYDESKIKTMEVSLKVQGPIKVRDLYPLAESVLKFTGLAMSRKGNLVTIVPIADTLEIDPALIEADSGQVKAGDVVVTSVFQLNYIDTASAKALLEGMKLGAVTEIPTRGTIIVTGYAYRMNRVEQLLDVVDKPGRPKQFKFRQLKYTMASTLAPKIKTLVEQLGDMSIAIAATTPTATPQPRRPPAVRQPTPGQPTPAATPSSSVKSSIYLDSDERTNRILMIGQEEELAVVEKLIDTLDIAQQDIRSLRVYEIQHVDAEEVRKKLEELGIVGASRTTGSTTPGGRITSRTTTPGAPGQPAAPPTPAAPAVSASSEGELPTEEMQVVVIESTNSLMVNASPEQHALVATIISYVDSESEQKSIPYKVYPLQNQSPDHIAEVLKKLLEDVIKDKDSKIEKVVKKTEENIIVVPDSNTFSLIVYANKKNQDWVADLIKQLDKRRPQVLIDVTLVEITKTDNFDLDLELASKFPQMAVGGKMDFLPALLGGKGDSNSNGFLGKKSRAEAFVSGGQGQGFYSDAHIQALLTAVQSKSYGRVLAKPKILVNDGQVGIIKTTDTVNVAITGNTVVGAGTASSGVVQTSTSYQAYNAGITLTIQPNIGEGDLLLLIVKLERSDFGARSAGADAPPDTVASTVDTIVTVPNNKTIILGGLLKLNQSKGGSKVPLLGDVPIVGALFRNTSDSALDSKLYVFVKANILRPEATLEGLSEIEKISERNRAAFEKSEDTFQHYEDVPGIKPTPVDPEKVLDAE
ncbi:MAG: secretin N-terminal domain-containing protein [Sedimentisphaerales bacterium]